PFAYVFVYFACADAHAKYTKTYIIPWGRLRRPRLYGAIVPIDYEACPTHLTIFSGVIGSSSILIPNGLSASSTARVTAGGATMRPPSPPPLTPNAVKGEGVSWW